MKRRYLLGVIVLALLLNACTMPGRSSRENEQVIAGKALYEQSCAACHGMDGEGQPNWTTPDENGIYPAPPHTADGHTWHHPDSILLETIANGGSMPNSTMLAFGEQLTETEMEAILAYVKTFWGEEERAFQELVTKQNSGNGNN